MRSDYSARLKSAHHTSASGCSSWPTPVANDDQKSPDAHMAMKARMKGGARHTITSLEVLAKTWPTPATRDHKSTQASATTHAHNARPLSEAAGLWATPSVADVTGGHKHSSGVRLGELLLNGQAALFGPQPRRPRRLGHHPQYRVRAFARYSRNG
jgi:hypothetical protein